MTRFRAAWLGLLALSACGSSFTAGGSGGSGGTGGSGAGSGGASSAGAAQGGSTPAAGAGGRAQGGASGHGGASFGGTSSGTGGTSGGSGAGGGNAGVGGTVGVSPIPTNGLSLWLRADVGVMAANGGVQTWQDQSGQQMDAVASAANVAPKLGKDALSGLPTLEFDGQQDYLSLPEGFADFTQGLSVFIVAKPSDGACASMWEVANGTEVQDISLGFYQNTWQYEVENQDVNGGLIDGATATLAVIGAVQRPGGAVELRLNSNLLQQATFDTPEVALRKTNYIGYTSYANCGHFSGDISEVIVYDRGLTISEVNALENYLEARYKIVIAVP